MSPKVTLVAGGGGFIGQAFVRLLCCDPRREVVVVGRSEKPKFLLPGSVRYVRCSVSDETVMAGLLEEADEVVDLAYGTVPKTSFEDPVLDVISNLPSSVSLQRLASRKRVQKYMLVSSGGTVYGHSKYLPMDEAHPNDPVSPYGISKLVAEKYALFFHRMEGLPVVVVRPGNPYGVGQIGQNQQGFIGAAIHAWVHRTPLEVYGERGTVRDYIYIDDLASGMVAALKHGMIGETYNIGTGTGHDNLQVLDVLEEALSGTGGSLQVTRKEARPFDVQANVLDSGKLRVKSGWEPLLELREGIETTYRQMMSGGQIGR
jgi:UDP-glucose 4-epimerase